MQSSQRFPWLPAALLGLALWLFPPPAAGDAGADPCRLSATVRDTSGRALPGAVATLLDSGLRATSDRAGLLAFPEIEAASGHVLFVAEGHAVASRRFDCEPGGEVALDVRLAPAFGEEMVVTATRTERRLAEVPVHTGLIPRQQIESSFARTLADAVEFSSGLRVESNCQNCNFSQIRMLGLEGPYTQILENGQPTVSSLAMVYGIEQLPARLLDSIEVVKGGASATYGGGAVGGVVNLIPHRADHTGGSLELRRMATGGEPGRSMSGLFDWTAAKRGRALSLFAQSDDIDPADVDGDGYSEVSARRLRIVAMRLEQSLLDGNGRLSLSANATAGDRRGGDLARFDRPPEQTSLTEAIRTRRRALALGWLHQASPRFDYQISASLADTDRRSYYGADFDPDAWGSTENPLAIGDLQANHALPGGTLTWGLQYSRDRIEDVQLGYGRVVTDTYSDLGLYVQDDRKLGKGLTLLYGARADRHSEISGLIVSPRAALLWSPRSNLTFRSSIASGFRPPVVFDEDLHIVLVGGGEARVVRPAPDLVEERATAYLLGGEWIPSFGRKGAAAIELNLFRTRLEDLFQQIEADDPTTAELEFVRRNAAGALVQGVELAASIRWGEKLEVDLGLVDQRSRFDRPEPDFGSRDFFRTPERYGSLSVRWQLPAELQLFAGAIHTGSMRVPHYAGYIAADRLETTPSFLTFDLNLSREIPLGGHQVLKLTLGARNLTDEYQRDLDRGPARDSAYVYGPRFPRTLFLGLELEW